jgi:hypothetical protein
MGMTGSWGDETTPDALAAALGLGVPDPKTLRLKVLQSSLRSRVNPAPMSARPTVAPVAPDTNAPAAAAPAGPDFAGQRARIEAALEELSQPKDLAALQAEGKRRGARGNTDMLMALAAQQAGPGFEGVQQTMLRQAMAARDPMKFTGGIVNEQGDVVEDPYFKQQEQRSMYERRLAGIDRGENAAALAAKEDLRKRELAADADRRQRELQAERLQSAMMLKQAVLAARGAGKDGGAGPGKTMTPGNIMKIAEMEKSVGATERLASEFKPEFAGAKGAAMTAVGSLPFANTDAAEWWRNYRREEELIKRHELFGATLTGSEGSAWRAADVNPTMDAGQIARRLERRAQIERDAYNKMVVKLKQGGWNVPGAEDAPTAPSMPSAPPAASAAAPAGGGWSVKVKGQ